MIYEETDDGNMRYDKLVVGRIIVMNMRGLCIKGICKSACLVHREIIYISFRLLL